MILPLRLTDPGPIDWVYYTPERFTHALEDEQYVVLEFTADWCLNCKAMEQAVLHSDPVAALAERGDVTFMKIDISSHANAAGRAKLKDVGRVAIPALVVFDPEGRQSLNRDFYTIDQVIQAVPAR